ncbi:MAG: prolipoprotein diacylglyceryl transferase [Alphaproteobacteria bacterium]|nr:MAG: prolipoprotein diacylglyceryl transferase [Alphaproteobacteria bacterium]
MQAVLPFPDIGPEIFAIDIGPVHLALRWYALAYIVGLLAGWRIVVALVRRPALWGRTPPATPDQIEALLSWVVLGVILGGRLGYVLFYQPAHYLAHPAEIPMVWRGGMSFHGGLLGVVLASGWFAWRHRLPVLGIADAMAVATPPGLFLGRIANFINGELWGRPTTLRWGVQFPSELAACPPDWPHVCARHPSQLYEAGLEGVLLGALLFWLAFRAGGLRRPGLLTGVFLGGYAISRFLVEFVRQPDPQFVSPENPLGHAIRFGEVGLTMGQLLSLPMLALAAVLIARARTAGRADPA